MAGKCNLPFGLLFMNPVRGQQEAVPLAYDDELSVTFVSTLDKGTVPYVNAFLQETVTLTEVAREQTDSDDPPARTRTTTATKAARENTDSD